MKSLNAGGRIAWIALTLTMLAGSATLGAAAAPPVAPDAPDAPDAGPFDKTDFYVNAAYGFHSNDARGATITVDPTTGPAGRAGAAARAGEELRRRGPHEPRPAARNLAHRLPARPRFGAGLLGRRRLDPGEPAEGVNDVHFHPAEPREARLTVDWRF